MCQLHGNKKVTLFRKTYQIIVISCQSNNKKELTVSIKKKATNNRSVFRSVPKCDIFPSLICSLGTNFSI